MMDNLVVPSGVMTRDWAEQATAEKSMSTPRTTGLAIFLMLAGCVAEPGPDAAPTGHRESSSTERMSFEAGPSGTAGGTRIVVKSYELLPAHPPNLSRIEVLVRILPPPTPGTTNSFALHYADDIYAETSQPESDGRYKLTVDNGTYSKGPLRLLYSPPSETGISTATRLDVELISYVWE